MKIIEVMHICPRCETTLSQGEVAEGYKDIKDLSATVKFKVKNPKEHGLPGNTFLLAWTTTPWTLPGNVALAVGENIDYDVISIEDSGPDGEGYMYVILSKERAEKMIPMKYGSYDIFKELQGRIWLVWNMNRYLIFIPKRKN